MKALNIVVCIKQVPDPRYWDKIGLDTKTGLLRREGIPIVTSPLDINALEEALRIKEQRGGKVTVISMGPPNTSEILTLGQVMGADESVLLTDRAFAGADTWATAYALAAGIKKLPGYDLILAGNESLDGSTAQVGPQLAEFLGIPHLTHVNKLDFVNEDTLRVRSRIEMGHMIIEAKLPAVVAVEKDINEPRNLSLVGIAEAKEKPKTTWTLDDLGITKEMVGLAGSPTQVSKVFTVEMKRKGEILSGDPAEIARSLIEKLSADGVIPKA